MENSGLRKGSWTEEEDKLLIACIQKYGEGKWRLIPQRAGLNRCQKSCRLRWLNYLSPNINRGIFTDDEIDMIQRFHKLAGNRWSLIAARLPGRTANDVKNFWHTHLRKKVGSHTEDEKGKEKHKETMNTQAVIRPQPHSFSKNSPWLRRKPSLIANDSCSSSSSSTGQFATPLVAAKDVTVSVSTNDNSYEAKLPAMEKGVTETQPCVADFAESAWWEAQLEEKELGNEGEMDFSKAMNDHDLLTDDFSWDDNLWDSSPWDL